MNVAGTGEGRMRLPTLCRMRTRMLVAAHKKADVPVDGLYLPVHVGHALNPDDLGYQPDDAGENISCRNDSYCELTALYWAWKNLDADAVGLSHYRRYFVGSQPGPHGKGILSQGQARDLLSSHDVVIARPRNYVIETIDSHYRHGHHGDDLDVLRDVVGSRGARDRRAFDAVFGGRKLSLYNMFLMRRDLFDAYMGWLMPILEECEERIDLAGRSAYQRRAFGYLGERLLNVWVRRSELSIATRPVVNTDGEPKAAKAVAMLTRKLRAAA